VRGAHVVGVALGALGAAESAAALAPALEAARQAPAWSFAKSGFYACTGAPRAGGAAHMLAAAGSLLPCAVVCCGACLLQGASQSGMKGLSCPGRAWWKTYSRGGAGGAHAPARGRRRGRAGRRGGARARSSGQGERRAIRERAGLATTAVLAARVPPPAAAAEVELGDGEAAALDAADERVAAARRSATRLQAAAASSRSVRRELQLRGKARCPRMAAEA